MKLKLLIYDNILVLSILICIFGTTLEEMQIYTIPIYPSDQSSMWQQSIIYKSHLSPFSFIKWYLIFWSVCVERPAPYELNQTRRNMEFMHYSKGTSSQVNVQGRVGLGGMRRHTHSRAPFSDRAVISGGAVVRPPSTMRCSTTPPCAASACLWCCLLWARLPCFRQQWLEEEPHKLADTWLHSFTNCETMGSH